MKVKKTYKSILRRDEYIYDVFGIYWGIDFNQLETYFWCLDPRDDALMVYSVNDIEIVDYSINYNTRFVLGDDMPGIYHWALIEKNLLDDIIDGIPEAKQIFLSILRSENLINKL